MKVIWKYPITNEVSMPWGAKILRVGFLINDCSYLWAIHSLNEDGTKEDEEIRRFRIVATGEQFDGHSDDYIGTYEEGPNVWHVFEIFD